MPGQPMENVTVMSAQTAPKIKLTGVSKTFAEGSIVALEGLDLEIVEGEIYCLLGPSGCGKSTALNLIAGFEQPTRGEIVVDGVTDLTPGPDRAVVFQKPLLYPWLTVLQNVTLGPTFAGVDRIEAREDAVRYLSAMGLEGFEKRYPYELSGGMQQRVALARAWINKPRILLLDEPFGALDAQTKIVMQELLLEIWEKFRTTMLYITHDIEEAIFLGDRVGVMSRRPATLKSETRVNLPRPRTVDLTVDPEFIRLKKTIIDELRDEAGIK